MNVKYLLRPIISLISALAFCMLMPIAAVAMDIAWPSAPTADVLDLEHAVRVTNPTEFLEIGLLKPVYEQSYRTAGLSLADPPIFA